MRGPRVDLEVSEPAVCGPAKARRANSQPPGGNVSAGAAAALEEATYALRDSSVAAAQAVRARSSGRRYVEIKDNLLGHFHRTAEPTASFGSGAASFRPSRRPPVAVHVGDHLRGATVHAVAADVRAGKLAFGPRPVSPGRAVGAARPEDHLVGGLWVGARAASTTRAATPWSAAATQAAEVGHAFGPQAIFERPETA